MLWSIRAVGRIGRGRSTFAPVCGKLIAVADALSRLRQRIDDARDLAARRRARLTVPDDGPGATGVADDAGRDVAGRDVAEEPASRTRSDRHPVPAAYRAAAAWSWRTLVIAAAIALIGFVLWQVRVVVFAIAIAVLLSALLQPAVTWLRRLRLHRGVAAGVVFVVFLALVSGVLTLVGDAVGDQFEEVVERAGEGLTELQAWFAGPPFYLTDEQIQMWVDRIVAAIGQDEQSLTAGAVAGAAAAVEFLSGLVIALFALLMFLYDGPGIWRWAVGLFPRNARSRVDGAGNQAWVTLTSYIRGQTLIAVFDGFFITVMLWILGVPLALALGVLVFFGAYVPLVGAIVAGAAAVLVAFVANGLVTAVIVLIGIIVIQQVEGNVFAPLVLGRMARIHPLAVVLAITLGVLVAGILGGIVAVPLVAMANSVGKYLAKSAEV